MQELYITRTQSVQYTALIKTNKKIRSSHDTICVHFARERVYFQEENKYEIRLDSGVE